MLRIRAVTVNGERLIPSRVLLGLFAASLDMNVQGRQANGQCAIIPCAC